MTILLALLTAACARAAEFEARVDARAFSRGNVHVHTSASDGDAPAAAVARWYADHGYAFLAITDHDLLTSTRAPEGLTLVPGVEVTSWSRSENKPVHVNALCARRVAKGVRARSGADAVLAETLAAARGAGGLTLVNHPSFGAALSSAVLVSAPRFDLLEIASAHPQVPGGAAEPAWDALLSLGRRVGGVAVDDAHDFSGEGERRFPGGAWIEAWEAGAGVEGVCAALRERRFYASTGARLLRLSVSAQSLEVSVADFNPASDRVEFIGAGGSVLAVADRSPARFELRGDEAYVRARVSQQPGGRQAWTQAYFVRQAGASRP